MKVTENWKIAERIAAIINKLQNGFATVMKNLTMRCSVKMLKLYCLLWSTAFAGLSTYFIYDGFTSRTGKQVIIEHISRPIPVPVKASAPPGDDKLYKRIHATRIWLDSIKEGYSTSLAIADSLIRQRPGLYDSLLKAEKLIQ